MKNNAVIRMQNIHEEHLYSLVIKRRKVLQILSKKVEILAAEISEIQEEYEQRVGILFRKESILEKEIHYYKGIRELLKKGISYEDAVMEMKRRQESEQQKVQENTADTYLDKDDGDDMKKELLSGELRKIWKKLVQQFHPDLAKTGEERREKEEIMKKINNAYREQDYEALKIIQEKGLLEELDRDKVEQLEVLLQDIENAIIRLEKELHALKRSQWYFWRKKSRKEKEALLLEMEREILREVLRKEVILDTLKKHIDNA